MAEYPLDPQLAKMVVASPEFRWHSTRLILSALDNLPSCLSCSWMAAMNNKSEPGLIRAYTCWLSGRLPLLV